MKLITLFAAAFVVFAACDAGSVYDHADLSQPAVFVSAVDVETADALVTLANDDRASAALVADLGAKPSGARPLVVAQRRGDRAVFTVVQALSWVSDDDERQVARVADFDRRLVEERPVMRVSPVRSRVIDFDPETLVITDRFVAIEDAVTGHTDIARIDLDTARVSVHTLEVTTTLDVGHIDHIRASKRPLPAVGDYAPAREACVEAIDIVTRSTGPISCVQTSGFACWQSFPEDAERRTFCRDAAYRLCASDAPIGRTGKAERCDAMGY